MRDVIKVASRWIAAPQQWSWHAANVTDADLVYAAAVLRKHLPHSPFAHFIELYECSKTKYLWTSRYPVYTLQGTA